MTNQVHAALGTEALAIVRRATARALDILKDEASRPAPFGRLALHVAIEKHVLEVAMTGERDEARLCKSAVAIILGARSRTSPA